MIPRPLAAALALVLACAFAPPALAAPAPLDPAALPPDWSARIAALSAPRALSAPFVETREIPLKKRPVVVEGVVRVVRGRGLSLDYAQPGSPLVILDERGLLLRHPDGRERTPPAEAAESLRLLHALFALDLATLGRAYEISGDAPPAPDSGAWSLVFTRRPDAKAHYRELSLSGDAARLTRIRLVRSERQTVAIELGAPRIDPDFSPEDLARWFR